MYAGVYIFEGIDNVGKTTIIQELYRKIEDERDDNCITLAFPGHEPRTLGGLVYDIHHHIEDYFDKSVNEASLQLLHIAAHIDLIQRKLIPLSRRNYIVLLDRFWWSTYVYGLAGGVEEEIIRSIIAPELLFWRNINIRKIYLFERSKRSKDYDIKKENLIIKKYQEMAEKESKCIRISNNGNLEKVVSNIYNDIFGE